MPTVLLCFVLLWLYHLFFVDICDLFSYILRVCITGTWTIVKLVVDRTRIMFSVLYSTIYFFRDWLNTSSHHFYEPVWKTDVLCRGNVHPSVCPSIRPRFPDFSSTCLEISIWNLVYTVSRWHDMSSLSCKTIWSLWPSLQPKVGQTHFLQSWPYKSRWILQIWYIGGLLYTSKHEFRFL